MKNWFCKNYCEYYSLCLFCFRIAHQIFRLSQGWHVVQWWKWMGGKSPDIYTNKLFLNYHMIYWGSKNKISQLEVLYEINAFKDFAKFAGKNIGLSLFFNNTSFLEHLRTAAIEKANIKREKKNIITNHALNQDI